MLAESCVGRISSFVQITHSKIVSKSLPNYTHSLIFRSFFIMAALPLQFVTSHKYVKGQVAYTSHSTDTSLCHLWSKAGGRTLDIEGRQIVRLVCTGCRAIRDKKVEWPAGATLRSLQADFTGMV
jgi:hypothetical protein